MRKPTGSSRRTALALAIAASLLAGCNSTSSEKQEPVKKQPSADAGTVQVQVQGAEAVTNADGSITLNYPESDDINDRIPDWVINPAIGGVTGAVGVAPGNDLGMREQLDEARRGGRMELDSMLELRVQRVGRSELEQDIRVEGDQAADRSRRGTLGVDRNILDAVLAGSRQRALWFDIDSGECYVWMVLDGALLERVDHHVAKGVSIFVANQKLPNEYKPKRKSIEPPTVIVQMPKAEKPEPAPVAAPEIPEPPKDPIEELEDKLNPIETIPVNAKDGGS
jgi:hypothetical protein